MKKMKIEMNRQWYKISFGILLLALLPILSVAKDSPEQEKHFTKEFEVDSNTLLKLRGYDHPVTIEHWTEDKILVDVTVNARGDEDQIDEFLKAIELEIEKKGNSIHVKTDINVSCLISVVGNKRMKIKGEGWIKLDDYSVDVHIKMPAINPIDAELSYCDLTIHGDVKGDFRLKNYEANTKLGNVLGEADIDLSYGTIEMGDVPIAEKIHLYEMDFTSGDLGSCTFESSYSKIHMERAAALCLKSYEDKVYFDNAESFTGTFSYSTIEGNNLDILEAKLYECKVNVASTESVKIDSKYTRFIIQSCKALSFVASYENKFDIVTLVVLSAPTSKYDVLNISQLTGALFIEGYETKVYVLDLSSTVDSFILKGNYMNADLSVSSQLYFDLEMDLTYPNMDFPEDEFDSFAKEKDDKLNAFLKSKFSNPKNKKFTFEGYEMNVDVVRK